MRLSTPVSLDELSSFGEALKFLRKRSRLKQAELARAVGYSREQITHLENNRRRPDPMTIAALFIPALNLEHDPEIAARLLSLSEAARTAPSSRDLDTGASDQSAVNPTDPVSMRAAHHLAAEAAELVQGDLVKAARQYYLARDFKSAVDILFDQAQVLSNQGRVQEATAVLDQILAEIRKSRMISYQAETLRRLLTTRGDLILNTARADEAEANYREALTLASGPVRTTLIYRLGLSLTQRGHAAEALAMVQHSYGDIPSPHLLIRAQFKTVESSALMALARFDDAEATNLEALALAEPLALIMPFIAASIRARAHNSLGAINAIRHYPALALEHWKQAVETARLAGLRSIEYRCQGNIANVLYETGDLAGALESCEAAIAGLRALDDLHGMAHFLHLRANLVYMHGDIELSLGLAEEACAVKRQLGEQRSLLVSLLQQAKSLLGLDRLAEARAILGSSQGDLDAIGDDRLRSYWLLLSCEVALLSGDYGGAREVVDAVTMLPNTAQELKLQGDCCNHLALIQLAAGEVDDASLILASYGATNLPEIEFERDLIRTLLDWARGDVAAGAQRAAALAHRAHEQGYVIFERRANQLHNALSEPSLDSLPYGAFPALIYGRIMS